MVWNIQQTFISHTPLYVRKCVRTSGHCIYIYPIKEISTNLNTFHNYIGFGEMKINISRRSSIWWSIRHWNQINHWESFYLRNWSNRSEHGPVGCMYKLPSNMSESPILRGCAICILPKAGANSGKYSAQKQVHFYQHFGNWLAVLNNSMQYWRNEHSKVNIL